MGDVSMRCGGIDWDVNILILDNNHYLWNNVCRNLANPKGYAHMSTKPNYDQLYEIAESQAGYFTAQQAREVGFTWERLSSNVKSGKFLRVARGIYRLFHFPGSPHEDLFVAWLRAGKDSVISHQSALAIYDLSDVIPGEVHAIISRTASRRRGNIRLHTNRLYPGDVIIREGLPVTTVSRTIVDVIVSGLAYEHIEKAIKEALQRGLVTREEMIFQARRRGGKVHEMICQVIEGEDG
jgi:predicted transcriptional regulator of viral defense system